MKSIKIEFIIKPYYENLVDIRRFHSESPYLFLIGSDLLHDSAKLKQAWFCSRCLKDSIHYGGNGGSDFVCLVISVFFQFFPLTPPFL